MHIRFAQPPVVDAVVVVDAADPTPAEAADEEGRLGGGAAEDEF